MRTTFRTMFLAVLAVFALSAVAASAAQAEEAPFFKVAGKRLAKGESKEVNGTTHGAHEVVVPAAQNTFRCYTTYAPGAKLLGSNAGEPGTAELTLEFSKCEKISPAHEGCKVIDEPIKSVPLKATLTNIAESEKKTKRLAVIYQPVKGNKFMTMQLSSQCGIEVENYEGDIAAQVRTAGAGRYLGEVVEEGKEPAEEKAMEWYFPISPISRIWRIKEGEGKLEKVELGTLWQGTTALEEGGPTLELASDPLWGVFT